MTTPQASRGSILAGNTDTGYLKLLALIFMIIDHSGKMLFPGIFEMRIIGRIAFPLYAWCLVAGSEYTRNIWRYALRIALVGLVAQPFYMLGLDHNWNAFQQALFVRGDLGAAFASFFASPNIFLTLLLGLLGIAAIKEKWFFSHLWGPVLAVVLGAVLHPDYSWQGVLFLLVLYGARKSRGGLFAAFLAYTLFWGTGNPVTSFFGWRLPLFDIPYVKEIAAPFFRVQALAWLALPFILFPTGTRFKLPKALGYAAYPGHLAILAVIVRWPELSAWFSGLLGLAR